ncbi:MAG TPA: ATP-binding protein [Mucilaginibacter sp.]|nr:ATP-binding protein [Mucilaginibacter sp.]
MYDHLVLKLVVAATLLLGMLAFFLVYTIVRHNNSVRQYLLREQDSVIRERELVLKEVSENIHNNITQVIQLIRRNLYTAAEHCTTSEQKEMISHITWLTEKIIKDTKDISHSLNADFIKGRGLYRMLEYDSDLINATKQLKCSIRAEGDEHCLPAESQLLVYRIAQEAMNNILQHAQAKKISIMLAYGQKQFKMLIRDDGIGFNETDALNKGMMGMKNMYQRAGLLNGTLKVESAQGKGSCITLTF